LCFDCPEEFALNVSQEAEMTVPQYLRKIRMERAGELSPTGKFIVSTARTVVGRTPRPGRSGWGRFEKISGLLV
jgi:hypothetical protein